LGNDYLANSERESSPMEADSAGQEEWRKTILAPVELKGDPLLALDYAIGLARHFNANLWLLPISATPPIGVDVRGLSSFVRTSWSRRAQIELWEWVLQVRKLHYRTFPLCACGDNHAEQIIRLARKLKADLIIVRAAERGRSFAGLRQTEASEILRRSTAPVFIALPKIDLQAKENQKVK
jgi:Universal stress protein family